MGLSGIYVNEYVYKYVWSPPVFKDKYFKALKKLMYVDLHNYLFNSDENWDYLSSHLFANDFKLIMQEYGNTFIQSALEESEDL